MIDAHRNRCVIGSTDQNIHKLGIRRDEHADIAAFRFGTFGDDRVGKCLDDIGSVVHGLCENGPVLHRGDDGGVEIIADLRGMEISDEVVDELTAGILFIADQFHPVCQKEIIFLCGIETQVGSHLPHQLLVGRSPLPAQDPVQGGTLQTAVLGHAGNRNFSFVDISDKEIMEACHGGKTPFVLHVVTLKEYRKKGKDANDSRKTGRFLIKFHDFEALWKKIPRIGCSCGNRAGMVELRKKTKKRGDSS